MIIAGKYHGIRLFLKRRYFLMIYVYIDVAKLNHFASLISSNGEILVCRSNSQTTVMASSISFPPSNHSTTKRSSSVLNQRLIMPTTWSATLLRRTTTFVSSSHSLLLPCGKITSAKRRQIRLTLTSSPRLLWCRNPIGSLPLKILTWWTSKN